MRKLSKELNLVILERGLEDFIDDWEHRGTEEENDWYNDSTSIFEMVEELKLILGSYKRDK